MIAGRLGRAAAKTAERERYARRAMETLRRAITAGYKHIINIRSDTDLDALRSRDDFQRLLADLEAEAPANPPPDPRSAGH